MLLQTGHAYRSSATARGREGLQAPARRRARVPRRAAGRRGGAPARASRGRDGHSRRDPRRDAVRARPPRRPRDRAGGWVGSLQLRGRDRRSRRGYHARRTRRGSRFEHAEAVAGAGGGQNGRHSARRRSSPLYAHLPLLHGPDGRKLSKRHGAASVGELRDAGYLPEAVRNYLALLGWGTGDDATVLSTDELVPRFTLRRVSRNPARFDEVKLKWLNGLYIRGLPAHELTRRLEEFTGREGLQDAVRISQEKISTLADFWPLAGPLLDGPLDDPRARERWLGPEGRATSPRSAGRWRRPRASTRPASPKRCRRWSAASRSSRVTSTSRCAWQSRGPRSRRASSRAWRCWAARRRSDASIGLWRRPDGGFRSTVRSLMPIGPLTGTAGGIVGGPFKESERMPATASQPKPTASKTARRAVGRRVGAPAPESAIRTRGTVGG